MLVVEVDDCESISHGIGDQFDSIHACPEKITVLFCYSKHLFVFENTLVQKEIFPINVAPSQKQALLHNSGIKKIVELNGNKLFGNDTQNRTKKPKIIKNEM